MFIRAYLRASTQEQDATRAKESLKEFASSKGHKVASYYTENESGRKLKRPELMKLIEDAESGDVILIESIDRLTRLTRDDWEVLKRTISDKGLNVVAVDLPTSHALLNNQLNQDAMTKGIMDAVNNMLIDILATMACKDYELRRQRSQQGIEKAKREDKYKGRPVNEERNALITKLLQSGESYTSIMSSTGASRGTIAKLSKVLKAGA